MRLMRIRLAYLAVFTLAHASVARAQDAKTEEARRHFDTAQGLYAKGDFTAASASFMAAYAAKPFPAFLFNAAVCAEKTKDLSKAIELFTLYLKNDSNAKDHDEVQKRVLALQAEVDRQAASAVGPSSQPSTPLAAPVVLPEAKTKGLVIIDSKPLGASIYIDNKRKAPVGVTPWNGELEGNHTLILESRGFKTSRKEINPSSEKGWYYYFELSEEHYLGWLEVRANVNSALVYLDRKQGGDIGHTTYLGNIQPGRHKIIVSKEGYVDWSKEIEIERGKSHQLEAVLEPAPVAFLRIRTGDTSEGAKVRIDGKEVATCPSAPCRFEVPSGAHTLSLSKGGMKPYSREMNVQRQTETTLSVRLAPKPSRTDAIWQFVYTAVFGGVGVYAYKAGQDEDCPGLDPEDAKTCKYVAYGLWTLGGLTFVTGIYYLFRDKGPPSTGSIESRDLSIAPILLPDRAGFGASLRF
jgi:hypothetical protein